MKILIVFVLAATIQLANSDSIASRLTTCGTAQGCWLSPLGCEQSSGPTCMGVVSWIVKSTDITFTLITYTADLTKQGSTAVYGAVGFSKDAFMGNDLVFVCALNGTGKGEVYLMWTDLKEPERLYDTTRFLVSEAQVGMAEGRMNCQFKWTFAAHNSLPPHLRSKTYNLSDPLLDITLLFARGHANPNTLDVFPHSVVDGLLFPYIASESFGFCETGCGQLDGMPWITQMHQAQIPQNLKQKIAISHAALMLLATFVLFPTAIMSARFNKDHLMRCCGVYMWFHLHWLCNMIGFACVSAAFFLIFAQNYFKFFQCSAKCTDHFFNRQIHAIYGTICYSLMCVQVLLGVCRPKIISPSRPTFNMLHTFLGYTVWLLCCRSALIGVHLGKAGLEAFFGRYGEHIIWIGIYCALACFAICEWIVHRPGYLARNPDGIENLQNLSETKLIVDEEAYETPTCAPMVIILFNTVSGLCITTAVVIMMLKAAHAKGFPF